MSSDRRDLFLKRTVAQARPYKVLWRSSTARPTKSSTKVVLDQILRAQPQKFNHSPDCHNHNEYKGVLRPRVSVTSISERDGKGGGAFHMLRSIFVLWLTA
ncbi:hypothetical protein OUZ56_010474 [Daphnia magna]|uniref:Uncharacterized protein n=1 Tax=Daphnia magna TaxID=35525 RepID=A0ABR0AIP1_9CRUS|nr:hypothetical protein OUZ56_010474 [Daphnia magna]